MASGDELLMRELDINVQGFRVAEGRLDPGVTQPFLHLVDGHPALKREGRGRVAENVGRHLDGEIAAGDNPGDLLLQGFPLYMPGRAADRDEKRRAIIGAGSQIGFQGDLRLRVEEGCPAFVAFAVFDPDGMLREIDVADVQGADLTDAGGGGVKEINEGFLAEGTAGLPDGFQLDRGHGLALRIGDTERFYMTHGTPAEEILIHAPLEKAIQDDALMVQRAVRDAVGGLVPAKIQADVRGGHLVDRLPHAGEEMADGGVIVIQGAFREVFNRLCGHEKTDGIRKAVGNDQVRAFDGEIIAGGGTVQGGKDLLQNVRIRKDRKQAGREIGAESIVRQKKHIPS